MVRALEHSPATFMDKTAPDPGPTANPTGGKRQMTRKLGIALLAALPIGVVAAQGASAQEFTSEDATTAGTGTNEGNHVLEVKPAGVKIDCAHAIFEGTQTGQQADTTAMTSTYSGCTVGALSVTVDDSGCSHVFDSDTTIHPHAGKEATTVDLDCNQWGSDPSDSVCYGESRRSADLSAYLWRHTFGNCSQPGFARHHICDLWLWDDRSCDSYRSSENNRLHLDGPAMCSGGRTGRQAKKRLSTARSQ